MRKLKAWHVAMSIPLVLGLGGWAYSEITARQARSAMEREIAALRAMGVAVTPQDLRRKIDPAQNGADLYRRAFDLYTATGERVPRLRWTDKGEYDPADLPAYRSWVAGQMRAVLLARRASEMPECEFNREWEQGFKVLFPEMARMKAFAKIAAFLASQSAEAGRYSESMGWLRMAMRIGRHSREQTLIGQLVAIACEQIAFAELQSQISKHGADARFVQAARTFLSDLGDLPSIASGMNGEVAMMIVLADQIDRGEVKLSDLNPMQDTSALDFEQRSLNWLMTQKGVRYGVFAKVLGRYRTMIARLRENPLDFRAQASKELDQTFMADTSVTGKLASIFAPVFAQAETSVHRLETTRRLTRCGLEVRARRTTPQALASKNAWAIDPFSGKPFVFRGTSESFAMYSVGPNGADDGGGRTSTRSTTDDIQFDRRRQL